MNTRNRLLSVILAVVLLLPALGAFSAHAETITFGEIALPLEEYGQEESHGYIPVKRYGMHHTYHEFKIDSEDWETLKSFPIVPADPDSESCADKYTFIADRALYNRRWEKNIEIYFDGLIVVGESTAEEKVYRFLNFEQVENHLSRSISTAKQFHRYATKYSIGSIYIWAVPSVRDMFRNGLMPKYFTLGGGHYTSPMNREMFCDVLAKVIAKSPNSDRIVNEDVFFPDTENESVYYLAKRGIVEGKAKLIYYYAKRGAAVEKGETKFRPNDLLTREEMVMLLRRAIDYLEVDLSASEKSDLAFSDDSEISDWAKAAVYDVYSEKILPLPELTDTLFAPKSVVSQQEGLVAAYRFFKRYLPQNSENIENENDPNYPITYPADDPWLGWMDVPTDWDAPLDWHNTWI